MSCCVMSVMTILSHLISEELFDVQLRHLCSVNRELTLYTSGRFSLVKRVFCFTPNINYRFSSEKTVRPPNGLLIFFEERYACRKTFKKNVMDFVEKKLPLFNLSASKPPCAQCPAAPSTAIPTLAFFIEAASLTPCWDVLGS